MKFFYLFLLLQLILQCTTFRPDALDKSASYRADWESKKEGGAEGTSFYSLVSLIKNTADDDSMDREMTFEEIGDYKVSAKVY